MSNSRLNQRIMAVMMSLALICSLAVTDVHAASSNKITLKKIVAPTNIDLGKSFSVKGKIKAKKKGSCYVWAKAHNGKNSSRIKIVVK